MNDDQRRISSGDWILLERKEGFFFHSQRPSMSEKRAHVAQMYRWD